MFKSPKSPKPSPLSPKPEEFEAPLSPAPVPTMLDLSQLPAACANAHLENTEPLTDFPAVAMQVAMLTATVAHLHRLLTSPELTSLAETPVDD